MTNYEDDDQLADALQLGDPAAGDAYAARFRLTLLKYAMSKRFSPDDAEDLAQETLLTGWRQMTSFVRGRDMKRWLVGIEHKLMLKRWAQAAEVRTVTLTSSVPTPQEFDVALSREDVDQLVLIQLHLTFMSNQKYAAAVTMYFKDELSLEHIAQALGLASPRVAAEYVRRGVRLLKEAMEKPLPDEPSPHGQ